MSSGPLHVYLPPPFEAEDIDRLRKLLAPSIVLAVDAAAPEPADYQILVTGRPTEVMLDASPDLTTVVIPWAGLPVGARDLLLARPHLAVHNLHHNAIPTAEMTVALLLAAAKDLISLDSSLRSGDWSPRYRSPRSLLLYGKNIVVLGAGAIGTRVASACEALGAHVTIVRRTSGDERFLTADSLPSLLPETDAIVVCLPLTPDTRGLLGRSELALLPDDAMIINTSRGDVINEEALWHELSSGRLRAGLDVWYRYPQTDDERSDTSPSAFPIHELPNVVMTPHSAGHTDATDGLWFEALADLLNAAAAGRPLPNRVDVARGY